MDIIISTEQWLKSKESKELGTCLDSATQHKKWKNVKMAVISIITGTLKIDQNTIATTFKKNWKSKEKSKLMSKQLY